MRRLENGIEAIGGFHSGLGDLAERHDDYLTTTRVRVFVDTSALIALLDEDDQWHGVAASAFRRLVATTTLVTTNYVEVEAVALARHRLGRAAVERLTDAILPALTTIRVDQATHEAALGAHAADGRSVLR